MKAFVKLIVVIGFITSAFIASAQEKAVNYYNYIDAYNLSHLWADDHLDIRVGDQFERINFPEPLGYIGGNYQRFYIQYTSVIKDPSNPYNYIVKGKTRVKDNISNFKGTITIVGAYVNPNLYLQKYNRGQVICKIELYEDAKQPESGYFKGSMVTNWYLDGEDICYDALDAIADGFSNNQCIATWTNYQTRQSLPCKWGDFRIPKSGVLDKGNSVFNVTQKYVNNGWKKRLFTSRSQ